MAAKGEFARKGFAGARMQAIARKAKVNKAMLHYYFGSKKNLYTRVLHRIFFAKKEQPMPIDLDRWQLEPAQKLHLVLFHLVSVHFHVLDEEYHQILAWEVAEGRKVLKTIAREFFIPRIMKLESVIKEGVKQGQFTTKNPLLVVWCLLSFFTGYGMQRDTFVGTEIEIRMYTKMTEKHMLEFLLEHFSHALGVTSIPDLSDEIKTEVLQMVQKNLAEMKENP